AFPCPGRGGGGVGGSVAPEEGVKLLAPTLEGERLVLALNGAVGDGVVLRFGLFYGPHARATDEYLRLPKKPAGPPPAHPRGCPALTHPHDAQSGGVPVVDPRRRRRVGGGRRAPRAGGCLKLRRRGAADTAGVHGSL